MKLIFSAIKIFLEQTKNEKYPELDQSAWMEEVPAGEQRLDPLQPVISGPDTTPLLQLDLPK